MASPEIEFISRLESFGAGEGQKKGSGRGSARRGFLQHWNRGGLRRREGNGRGSAGDLGREMDCRTYKTGRRA